MGASETVVIGVGTDILLIDRIRSCLDSSSFMRRTFTALESSRGGSRPDPASYYAKVFAGKEAVFKCFGISADDLGSWRDIEIVDSEEGQPTVNLRGSMESFARERRVSKVLVSLSYDTDYALATAALVADPHSPRNSIGSASNVEVENGR
jgi:holo-[acyl-carrier protein] synthase